MRWRWVVLGLAVLALVGVPLLLAWRLLTTDAGLRLALAQLERLPSVRVVAMGANGTLAGPLTVDRLLVEHEAVRIEAQELRLDLRLRSLLAGNVHLDEFSARRIEVVLKAREERPPEPIRFLPRFLEVVAPEVVLDGVALTLVSGERYPVDSVRAALAMTRWRIDLTDLVLADRLGRVDGMLTLRATQPLGLRGAANGRWQLPDERLYRFAVALDGNLDRLGTTLTLAEPAEFSFIGNALALTEAPRIVGTLRTNGFDGSPWIEAGRLPPVAGSVALDAGRDSIGVDGTLVSAAFGDEPVRLQGNGRWLDRTIEIAALRAWLPRSSLSASVAGTVELVAEQDPALKLAGEWTALRWPLAGEPVFESPIGAFTLQGAMPYGFEVQTHALLPGFPVAEFAAAGSLDRERLVLDRLDGRALGGRVSGGGRLDWDGEQRWSARVDAKDIDLATVRKDLPGRVSVVATIEGRGLSPTAPWTAKLASVSGRVLGRALTGRGEISHREGEYELRDLRIANGDSYANIDGRWGSRVDLRWSADLRNLTLLHPDFAGELASSGRLTGSPARPGIVAEAHGRRLRFDGVTAASLDAEVDADLADGRESRVDLRAGTVEIGPVLLDNARLQAHGLAGDHRLEFDFSSPGDESRRMPGFGGRAAATGGYAPTPARWRGRLEQVSLTFADGTASLLQPAALEVGAGELRAEPVCLAAQEARLCAEGEWQAAPAAWRFLYSVQDWPLRRLLRNLFGWREFDGRLQASGWAEQLPGREWLGGTTAYLDDPVLDVPRNKFRTQRIRLGSGRLDLFATAEELRADVNLDLAEGSRMQGQVSARRTTGRPMSGFPVAGTLRAESQSLTGLPVLVPEIDRSDGSLEATLTVGGTLGEPRFDGEFHVRDGRFDMYRTNLSLAGVTLDGRFVGDELVFQGRGTAKEGELALDGRFSWPEGVMTGRLGLVGENLTIADTPEYRIVASPDLTVQVGADGYDVTGEVRVPVARISPRDLSTTVSTSPDERIVGMEVVETGPSTLERVRSSVRVVLGDDVRVDSYGLKAKLAGDVTVLTRPGDVVRGDGAIRVVEGEYKAFGQYVRITRGVLSFARTPINEPTLDLVGEREIKGADIVVRINVRGTLSNPFVTLSSEPPMPENEALSYLIMGRSLNTLQSGEAASIDRAAQSLAISGGGLLLGGIGTRLGLDEVAVEQDEEDASVVIGKYLSPKLFVSYGISIVEAINTVKLRYSINERWSLKAEAGLEQSADVEFKIER
jgi:translocation and assembly module TamB